MNLLSLREWWDACLFLNLLFVIKSARQSNLELQFRRRNLNRLWLFYFSFNLKCGWLGIRIPQLVDRDRFWLRHLRVAEPRMPDKCRTFLVANGLDVSQL